MAESFLERSDISKLISDADTAGYNRGYSAGNSAGYSSGYSSGYSNGYSAGQSNSSPSRFAKGWLAYKYEQSNTWYTVVTLGTTKSSVFVVVCAASSGVHPHTTCVGGLTVTSSASSIVVSSSPDPGDSNNYTLKLKLVSGNTIQAYHSFSGGNGTYEVIAVF